MPSKKPILIVGDRISQTNAVDEAIKLARGCRNESIWTQLF